MIHSSGKKKLVSIGPYRFTGKILGKGNFARVEEAVHGVLNLKVAVKIMDLNQIKEDYVIRNLCREAQIMSRLNHPCIAALYQTIQKSDNVYYLVTELVSGGDLCTFVKGQRNGKLEERSARIYARQFASALSHMHSLGVVHRDLKMENVMLNSIQTQIKIVDFGLSNVWTADSPLRTHCGSPEYAAPELFITGRQYGAEVDLWSLGIILYGMVLGQLPFITNRTDHVSSQERRKKLVAQINKGLSTAHRRALALFSPEFRHLMNKLLIANSSERINTKELIAHPWITEKGKKLIKINPLRVLDDKWKAKIISEMETLIQVDSNLVISAIIQDPLGKIGGIYNILVHKQQLSQLIGDGITKNLSSLTLMEISQLTRNSGKSLMKIASARPATQRKPYTAMACCRKLQFSPPRDEIIPKENKNQTTSSPKKPGKLKRKESAPARTPITAQPLPRKDMKMVDYRLITSPTLRRKAYSATITPKTNRPRSPAEGASRPTSPKFERPTEKDKDVNNKRPYEMHVPDKIDIQEKTSIKKINSARSKIKLSVEPKTREMKTRVLTGVVEKSRSKSDQLRAKNSTTLSNKKATKQEKINVTVSYSASRAADKSGSANSKLKPHDLQREIFNRHEPWERSVYAFGDSPVRAVTAPSKQARKPTIYDPIAKSIADYVANNVPDKMNKFSWYRR